MSAAPSVSIMSNDRCWCWDDRRKVAGGGSATGAGVTRRTLEPGEKPVQCKQCGQWGYQPSQICSMQHCSAQCILDQLHQWQGAAANLPSSLVAGCQRLVAVWRRGIIIYIMTQLYRYFLLSTTQPSPGTVPGTRNRVIIEPAHTRHHCHCNKNFTASSYVLACLLPSLQRGKSFLGLLCYSAAMVY